MNTATTAAFASPVAARTRDGAAVLWLDLAWLLAFALLLRLAFFNGAFGSDDVVYFWRSVDVARGEWTSANYNGALRYGFNIPAGALMALFGATPFVANLWPLACSLAEVALVYVVAAELWGRRAAICAALLLAAMPLHVAVATRLHADPVVSFFLSLGFALFLFALRRRSRALYFGCGLALGMVFWVKELAAVTLFAFFVFPLAGRAVPPLERRWEPPWGWVVAGAALMLALNLALMRVVTGDALHLFKVVLGAVSRNFIHGGQDEDAAGYYLRYLFLDLRHTWIAALLACGGVAVLWRRRRADGERPSAGWYAVAWLLALLAVLSLFPVSLRPLRLVMKQSNYLTLFLAPIALLAGYFIAVLPRRAAAALLAVGVAGGVLLGALQQADYRVFTANSKAAAAFARAHAPAVVVGSTNNSGLSVYGGMAGRIPSFADVLAKPALGATAGAGLYAVLDPQTIDWKPGGARVAAPLPCWKPARTLEPLELGLGNALAGAAAAGAARLPGPFVKVSAALQRLARPGMAVVYRVDAPDVWCGAPPAAR